jgi:glycosyltransferase involved in cell wall biosynthesis
MKIIYFINRISISGGVKVLFQHLRLLRARGVEAELMTLKNENLKFFGEDVTCIPKIEYSSFDCDICVATKPRDILALFRAGIDKMTPICHFIQGDQIGELEKRISTHLNYEIYSWRILGNIFKCIKYFRRKKQFEKAFRLPTIKFAVSKHLCDLVKDRFQEECFLLSNGIDLSVFRPNTGQDSKERGKNWRIVSIGHYKSKTKGIEHILNAIGLLKSSGYSIHLTRIAGGPISVEEKQSGLVDSYFQSIPERDVAGIIQASDVLVLGSLEEEGFGLPALEAMACRIPCVLTEIPAFLNLDEQGDFACFVPPRDPQAIADGVRKIIMNKEYRSGLEQRGLQVAQNYSLETLADRLEIFFSNRLGKTSN